MDAAPRWLALLVAACGPAVHAAENAALLHVAAGDERSLQDSLLALAQERLQPAGLLVDGQHAWLSLSAGLPSADTFEVRPAWSDSAPVLPLKFELRPASGELLPAAGHVAAAQPIQATLAVSLLREVWVAARRLRKGSNVTCADLSVQRRDIRDVPKLALSMPCNIEPGVVALRDIAPRDALRSGDIGKALDVTAGGPVQLSVSVRGISVTTSAVALADARVGDQIEVRLRRPARTLSTRVIGPGSVKLTDRSL